MATQIRNETVRIIKESYAILNTLKDLPFGSDETRTALTALRTALKKCQETVGPCDLLETPELAEERTFLPDLLFMAACKNEKFWARKFLAQTEIELENFLEYDNYVSLCHEECALIQGKTFNTISMLGSGSMPMTAFMMARFFKNTKIICIEYDTEAVELSTQITKRIGLEKQIEVRLLDAEEYVPQKGELVIIASLLQNGRQTIYERAVQNDCSIIVRDVVGMIRFFRKPAELPSNANFDELSASCEINENKAHVCTSRYFIPKHMHHTKTINPYISTNPQLKNENTCQNLQKTA